jgi:serine/threonine protein kinase
VLESNHALDVGQIIADRYRIVRPIGRGGMSIVVEAAHLQLGRRIALKLVPRKVTDATCGSRVVAEAQAAARLSSEHTVRVFDCGMHGAFAYIVMELLSGHDLKEHLEAVGTLPVAEAVAMILQVCEAVAEAHAHGIVHADLKPSNLFVGRRPDGSRCMKVLDFGIARSVATEIESGFIAGSPGYAAPEQLVANETIDTRADIWALGVILYQMIMGELPFASRGLDEALLSSLTKDPRPLRSPRGPLPPGFADVVMRCLAKDREDRHANVGELVLALAPFTAAESQQYVKRTWAVLSASGENAVIAHGERQTEPDPVSFSSYAPVAIDATAAYGDDDADGAPLSRDDDASLVGELVPARPRTGLLSMLAATIMLVVLFVLARNHLPASRTPVRTAASAAATTMVAASNAKPAMTWVLESGPPSAHVVPPIVASVTSASASARPVVKPQVKRPLSGVKGRAR